MCVPSLEERRGLTSRVLALLDRPVCAGDVQPFVVLARALVQHGHRVRLATHGTFRQFVHDAGRGEVEFFDIGGDPKELLAWMVKSASAPPPPSLTCFIFRSAALNVRFF